MRRDQLEHAIRTACQIIGHPAVIIVGSHAIPGGRVGRPQPAGGFRPRSGLGWRLCVEDGGRTRRPGRHVGRT